MANKKTYLFSVVGKPHIQVSSTNLNVGLSLVKDTNLLLVNGIPYKEAKLQEDAKTNSDAKELLDALDLEKKVEKEVKKKVDKAKEIKNTDISDILKDGE